jgi:hypothetical protein
MSMSKMGPGTGVGFDLSVTRRGSSKSGRGQPQSKTLRAGSGRANDCQVLECSLPILYRCGCLLEVSVTQRGSSKSGRGQPQSKTLSADSERANDCQVLECGCSLPILYRCGCLTVLVASAGDACSFRSRISG